MALTIAIDGPAGAGKSSAAKAVAHRLDVDYIDTGAMYRALTWWMLHNGVDIDDPVSVGSRAGDPRIEISGLSGQMRISVDGEDVTEAIRRSPVSEAVSRVSAVPEIRGRLVELQRAMVAASSQAGRGVVMEGRDIGTVVMPEATVKVFLTADLEVRAARRAAEDRARNPETRHDHVNAALMNLRNRDETDTTRESSPLVMAEDAVRIDATNLTLGEVVEAIAALAQREG